jgi:flagellar motor switch protein FliN/FliY
LPDVLDTAGVAIWLAEEWMTKLASSVEMMTEVRPALKLGSPVAAAAPDVPVDALWYSIPLSLSADMAIFVGAAEETWLHIGKSALLAAGVTEVTPDDARGTYLEIIGQATSGLAQAIGERLETSISCLAPKAGRPGALLNSARLHPVEMTLGDPPPRTLYLVWSLALESARATPKCADLELTGGNRTEGKRSTQPEKSRTLDLLMEVELPVSVSFGRAQLPLRDVLKLTSGSIVELNRTISDPVEIIVNNCVIARGEVVVVEGNYGVRIHQVISREERLRTLK